MRIVAPSGPIDEERFATGLGVLAERYEPVFDREVVYARTGFLAGDDSHRLESLHKALHDDRCRAVFLARGGYGLTRIVDRID